MNEENKKRIYVYTYLFLWLSAGVAFVFFYDWLRAGKQGFGWIGLPISIMLFLLADFLGRTKFNIAAIFRDLQQKNIEREEGKKGKSPVTGFAFILLGMGIISLGGYAIFSKVFGVGEPEFGSGVVTLTGLPAQLYGGLLVIFGIAVIVYGYIRIKRRNI